MVTKIIITCDVKGCKENAKHKVDCCWGWVESDEIIVYKKYKKFEKPTEPEKTDLCDKHWKEWSKKTCKILKMDKEEKS